MVQVKHAKSRRKQPEIKNRSQSNLSLTTLATLRERLHDRHALMQIVEQTPEWCTYERVVC